MPLPEGLLPVGNMQKMVINQSAGAGASAAA